MVESCLPMIDFLYTQGLTGDADNSATYSCSFIALAVSETSPIRHHEASPLKPDRAARQATCRWPQREAKQSGPQADVP